MKIIKRNYIKEVAKQVLRRAVVTTKHYLSYRCTNSIPIYQQYWNSKAKHLIPRMSWKINGIYKHFNPNSKRCNLCLTEKLEILDNADKNLLNKRLKIIS